MTEKTVQGGAAPRTARKGETTMYTEYGYEANGIEYATVDEAYEDN